MKQIDQFESIFRSALKDVYKYRKLSVKSVLVVTDRKESKLEEYLEDLRCFLAVLGTDVKWTIFDDEKHFTAVHLLEKVAEVKPDLICTYRNLHSAAWQYPYSLGEHLDVLMQKTAQPVMILPHPDDTSIYPHAMVNTNRVMTMTDHLAKDHRLIDYGILFTEPQGILFLSHIEDQRTFSRYMEVISRIPDIDTDHAAEEIRARLVKEPSDYIDSCIASAHENKLPIEVKKIVGFGHHISEYRKLIEEHEIDLLIMNSKDDDQLAMHGMTYPLAVELRQIALLFL
ncbi:MAG TPA: hypothetical protein VL625_09190 [Patescibacteria group bacterium]|nr:hypothetical protein [Patescibacteria group bacterium]